MVGVEMNDFFCKLQRTMVQKHRLQDRIEVRERKEKGRERERTDNKNIR